MASAAALCSPSFWEDARNIEDLTYRLLSGENVPIPPRVPKPHIDLHLPPQLVQLDHFLRNPAANKNRDAGGAPTNNSHHHHGHGSNTNASTPLKHGSSFSTPVKTHGTSTQHPNSRQVSPYSGTPNATSQVNTKSVHNRSTPDSTRKKVPAKAQSSSSLLQHTSTSKSSEMGTGKAHALTHVSSAPNIENEGPTAHPKGTLANSNQAKCRSAASRNVSPLVLSPSKAPAPVHTPTDPDNGPDPLGTALVPLPTQAPLIEKSAAQNRPRTRSPLAEGKGMVPPGASQPTSHLSSQDSVSDMNPKKKVHLDTESVHSTSKKHRDPTQPTTVSTIHNHTKATVEPTVPNSSNLPIAPPPVLSHKSALSAGTEAINPSHPTVMSSDSLPWSLERIPPNVALVGSRREKYELTLKRLANQKPVDPDFIFGGRNFEVPLAEIFQQHKSAVMQMGPDPRGKSGDWFADHFDAEEEYEYKLAAKMLHICPTTRNY